MIVTYAAPKSRVPASPLDVREPTDQRLIVRTATGFVSARQLVAIGSRSPKRAASASTTVAISAVTASMTSVTTGTVQASPEARATLHGRRCSSSCFLGRTRSVDSRRERPCRLGPILQGRCFP